MIFQPLQNVYHFKIGPLFEPSAPPLTCYRRKKSVEVASNGGSIHGRQIKNVAETTDYRRKGQGIFFFAGGDSKDTVSLELCVGGGWDICLIRGGALWCW
mmetsp:Transcript_17125/g.25961  ORF Transcript_17125/g.25961 Transcript_17125/m.25961 type:complete len:100 (+) Transcript_17125:380-679(+)